MFAESSVDGSYEVDMSPTKSYGQSLDIVAFIIISITWYIIHRCFGADKKEIGTSRPRDKFSGSTSTE